MNRLSGTDLSSGPSPVSRRTVLAGVGGLGLGALAGCLGMNRSTGTDGTADQSADGQGNGSADGNGIEDHPGAVALDEQPWKGPDPMEAEIVIVAFEDPSCSRCRAFERNTVPEIESKLVETGRAAFVYRGYPVVYPWGEPASHALEATYARGAEPFWALLSHYFETQSEFDTDNVLDRTAAFLDESTDVDGQAVVEDVRAASFDAAIQTDLKAGENADVGRTTPTILLFKDGSYRTRAAGSVSYSVIANALGL